jgi:hypothetical protein
MAQTGFTPILVYASGTASSVPLAADLTSSVNGAELALNYADGKLYYKNSSAVVTLLASAAGASGDVVGPASSTDNAVARFDLTTGKLIQNSVAILSDAGILTGLTGLTSSGNVTLSALTATRVPYASTGGLLVDSTNLTFNGTILTAGGLAGPFNGTVGATTANTGAFTTVTASTPIGTASGGTGLGGATPFTANGVVYASSTSALATGSALTFDGTYFTVGASSTTGDYKAFIQKAGGELLGLNASSGTLARIAFGNTTATFGSTQIIANAADLAFITNSAEQMRLSSSGLEIKQSQLIGYSSYAGIGTNGLAVAGNLGVGIASPVYRLDVVQDANSFAGQRIRNNDVGASAYAGLIINANGNSWGMRMGSGAANSNALELVLDALGTPSIKAIFDSAGNVGIGTTSTTSGRLSVSAGTAATGNSLFLSNPDGTYNPYLQIQHSTAGVKLFNGNSFGAAANNLIFGNSGTAETMRIDSAGNLGLGVTPSNFAVVKAFQAEYATLAGNSSVNLATNAYFNSGWKYTAAASALLYTADSGSHKWYRSTSTQVINTDPVFSQAMTLDASGNLLIGATAIYTAAFTGISVEGLTSGTGNLSLGLNKAGTSQILSGDVLGNIYFYGVDNDITAGNNNIGARIASIATTNWTTDGTTSNAALVFYTHGTTSGAPEERARIDSVGRFSILTANGQMGFASGNTAGGVKIQAFNAAGNADGYLAFEGFTKEYGRFSDDGTFRVKGAGTAGSTDAFQVAGTAPADAARIDSSGNFLIGTASVIQGGTVCSFFDGQTRNGIVLQTSFTSGGTGFIRFVNSAGTAQGEITANSTTTVTYGTSSDYRLKTVIGPVANPGQRIDALQPVEYTWNSNGSRTRGFLAHQFQEVYASSVNGTKDAVDAEGKPVYQSMQASTSEVIADLVAEIQDLRARVAALEAA